MKRINMYLKIVIVFSILVLSLIGFFSLNVDNSKAKFSDSTTFNHYIKSNALYFKSDLLSNVGKTNYINNYNYTNIPFNIYNYLNDDKVTDYDISYTIGCTVDNAVSSYYNCYIDSTLNTKNGSILNTGICKNNGVQTNDTYEQCINNNYTWYSDMQSNSHNLRITNVNTTNVDEFNVIVTVEVTSPFKYTLTGTFHINNIYSNTLAQSFNVSIDTSGYYCILSITNDYYDNGNITINLLNNKYLFDETDSNYINSTNKLSSNNVINSITLNVPSNSRKMVKLFKNNNTCSLNNISYSISS